MLTTTDRTMMYAQARKEEIVCHIMKFKNINYFLSLYYTIKKFQLFQINLGKIMYF